MSKFKFDEKDAEILRVNMEALDQRPGIRTGDIIRFACGTVARVAHVWTQDEEIESVQPASSPGAHGDGYYLGKGYVSMSGGLNPSIKIEHFTDTGEKQDALVWFFHHNWSGAGHGVFTTAPFRVFTCDLTHDHWKRSRPNPDFDFNGL
jgi:hypothetical protein